MARIGLYLRISQDPDGSQTATQRQRADCERYAAYRGWEIADVFEDVDTSAFKPKVRRAQFERMVQAVERREIDGVLAYRVDRLARRLTDFVKLYDAAEATGAFIVTTGDGIDTSTDGGRFVAPILVQIGNQESRNQSARLRRKAEEMARDGRAQTGGSRMFGYTADRSAVVPTEAEYIREAAKRVLAGESIRGLCFDFKARGITTSTGGAWQPFPLKRLLRAAALSGQREHYGKLTPGTWPAILTPDDTRKLRAVLDDPGRRKNHGARRYLLAGFLRCGVCGEPLLSRPRLDKVRRYVCARRPGSAACGKVARLAEPIEEVIREAVCIALDGVDLRSYVEQPTDQTAEILSAIRADEEALEQLSRDCNVDRLITRSEWLASREPITARLEANRRRLAQASGRGVLSEVVGAGDQVRALWHKKGLDWQRALLSSVIDHVVLEPAVKGSTKFRPEFVRIVWKF